MLYVTGDSHHAPFLQIGTQLPHNRSTTIFTACKTGLLDFKDQNIVDNSLILISLGEIDIRCRVYDQAIKQSVSYHVIIDDLIDTYFNKLKEEIGKFNNIICIVYIGPISDVPGSPDNPEFPRKGSVLDRIGYRKYMIESIKSRLNSNILFYDVAPIFENIDGILSKKFFDRFTVHFHEQYHTLIENHFIKFLASHKLLDHINEYHKQF